MKKTIKDNRMEWILHFEENSKNKNSEEYFTDYEICSEVRIPGNLQYDNNNLQCRLLSFDIDERGLYSYTIRVKHIQKDYIFDKNKYSQDGYYYKHGLIGELMAIFSVYFQTRFFLKSSISVEISPTSLPHKNYKQFRYIKPHKAYHYEMFTDQKRNWAHEDGLKKFLDDIKKIDGIYHQSLIYNGLGILYRYIR